MQIIESALAFALTMLVLSLVASTLVEMIHRLLAMREKGMHSLLGQLFDRVLEAYAKQAHPGLPPEMLEQLRRKFQDRMTANRAPIGIEPESERRKMKLGDLWSGRKLNSLSLTAFMERLGSDDVGGMIVKAAKAAAEKADKAGDALMQATTAKAAAAVDTVLQDVAQKYENFCTEASEIFARRARFFSVTVAIGLAFALHVDAVELFQTFMRDPAVRNALIEQYLDDALKQTAPPPVVAATPQGNLVPVQLEQQIQSIQNAQAQLAQIGVPIGWTAQRIRSARMMLLVWNCPGQPAPRWFAACGNDPPSIWLQVPTNLARILSLLLGGVLIGLGGPFWFDAVRSLTSLRSVLRGPAGEERRTDANAPVAGDKAVTQPRTPVDVFKVAYEASQVIAAALTKSALQSSAPAAGQTS